MANMIMNTIYNQYLTTYAPKKSDTRYDTHKRSELRNVYNSMVKVNRDAPLYILDNSSDMRKYIVGLKEQSRELHNTIASVSGDAENIDFNGKVAYSSDENILSAKYVGKGTPLLTSSDTSEEAVGSSTYGSVISKKGEIPSYNIEVKALASPQVNLGNFLPGDQRGIAYGDYSFDVNVGDYGYEFQFSVQSTDTNLDIQNRLSRLINNSGIGLKSSVESDENGNYALRIESLKVGQGNQPGEPLFSITDNPTAKLGGSVEFLGLNYTAGEASDAHFTINGVESSAASNSFVLADTYEINLHNLSPNEGQTVTIGIKPDTEALQENISNLLMGYNRFIKNMQEYQESQTRSTHLVQEFGSLSSYYNDSFEKIGIHKEADGSLSLDTDKLNTSVAMNESEEALSDLKHFSTSMIRKTAQVSLNPIHYVNKTIVAYKNPGNTLNNPYVSSSYAGMMFNSYC